MLPNLFLCYHEKLPAGTDNALSLFQQLIPFFEGGTGQQTEVGRINGGLIVKADLPEVKKEDVKLTVQDDVMSISGERKYEKEEKGKKYHRVERAYGSFMRSFTLPEDADGSKVSAEYKDGVLKVRLPKSEKAKPKSIEVKVS